MSLIHKIALYPSVQIFTHDTKIKEIGTLYNTPEFTFRTTGDELLKVCANKCSSNLVERDLYIGVVSKHKQCIDIEKEVNFYFCDGTFLNFIPEDDGVEPCLSYIYFNFYGQYGDTNKQKVWRKLLQVPLKEIRVAVKTKENNSIFKGLTKEQGLAFRKSLQMLDTATTGVQRITEQTTL